MNIFIGTSSSSNLDDNIKNNYNELIEKIAKLDDTTLVFGAAYSGIMGNVAEIFNKNKKDVIGVSLNIYKEDIDEFRYSKIYFLDEPVDRTKKIHDISDIALFLPGGIGTMEELFTFMMNKDEMKDDKLIILYNKDFFFTPLLEYMYKLKQDKFIRNDLSNYLFISNDDEEIINKIKMKIKEKR